VAPRLHISHAGVVTAFYSSIFTISGAIQYGVPTTEFDFEVSENYFATPKSANLTTPSFVVKIFAPLMSLWTTFLEWRYCSPISTCLMYMATSFSGKGPNFFIIVDSEPLSRYSSMMLKEVVE